LPTEPAYPRVTVIPLYCRAAGSGSCARTPSDDKELIFKLVQLCGAATGHPLEDNELRLIAAHPRELSLPCPEQVG
jgi:hypothetical protein